MSNNFFNNDDGDGDVFMDIPDEVTEGQSAPIPNIRTNRPPPPQSQPKQQEPEYETASEDFQDEPQPEEDFSSILNDARFRLEQGRLYEMIMNHDIFGGTDADEKAIKYVTKQIRNFAKEQMEIMLGMRQEMGRSESLAISYFPFNDLEVQTLKALASAATKGATATPEAQQYSGIKTDVPRKVGLNQINAKPSQKSLSFNYKQSSPAGKPLAKKSQAPIRRDKRTEAQIEQILSEERITREEYERQYNPNYKPLMKPLNNMSEAEIKEWRRQDALKTHKQVKNSQALPMPTAEQEEFLHTQRATAAASHPQMQGLMNLLLTQKKT